MFNGLHYIEYLWWLLWLITPITIYCVKYIALFLSLTFEEYSLLGQPKQSKVKIKTLAIINYLMMFILTSFALYPFDDVINGVDHQLSTFEDITLKCGCVFVVSFNSFYVSELYCHKQMKWYLMLHHVASSAVCLIVFDARLPFDVICISRFYIGVFGLLLTNQWILYFASVYYYLGNKTKIQIRLSLYVVGILSHVIFTFGQLYFGILFQINSQVECFQSVIIFLLFQSCILPTQIMSFFDFYIIITKKILIHANDLEQKDASNVQIEIEMLRVPNSPDCDENTPGSISADLVGENFPFPSSGTPSTLSTNASHSNPQFI